jgi:hypothetical protein
MRCDYSTEEVDRLMNVKYEERPGGFACGSCNYFQEGDCSHPDVNAKVKDQGCCVLWDGKSEFKASECKK